MKSNYLLCLVGFCLFSSPILSMEQAAKNSGIQEQQRTPSQEVEYVRQQAIMLAKQQLESELKKRLEQLDADFAQELAKLNVEFYKGIQSLREKGQMLLEDMKSESMRLQLKRSHEVKIPAMQVSVSNERFSKIDCFMMFIMLAVLVYLTTKIPNHL